MPRTHQERICTIAVLTAELSDAYQAGVWNGISAEAAAIGCRVVCFLGSRLQSPVPQECAANDVYRLADARNFDGLIVVTSAISTYLTAEDVAELFEGFAAMPCVSIGVPATGVSCVAVDARSALAATTRHLIRAHGRRRIAIVAGPERHVESEQRRAAVLDVLRSEGLDCPVSRVIHGTFERESGTDAVRTLLDAPEPFDALICLNDRMALGALEELHRQGISVPDQIALVGFDGIEETAYCTPPLTTVQQPLFDLGAGALRELMHRIAGGAPRNRNYRCRPLVRESCGCGPPAGRSARAGSGAQMGSRRGTRRDTRGERLVIPLDCRMELTSAAAAGDSARFLQRFNREMAASLLRGEALEPWEQLLNQIRGALPRSEHLQERLLDQAADMLGEMKCRTHAARRLSDAKHAATLRAISLGLTEAFETSVLVERLRDGLRRIGFTQAYLVLYENGGGTALSLTETERLHFDLGAVLPNASDAYRGAPIWILTPLVFQSRSLGYLLLPGGFPDTGVYETIGKHLSSSLQGALLMDQVKDHEQSLEREVERRTHELTRANRALRKEVDTRIRLESEVAEISRRTMERIGQDLHDDLCQHLAGIAMHVSALEHAAVDDARVRGTAALVNRLLGDSIERARAIVRGLVAVGLREEGLLVALNALIDAARRSSGLAIEFRACDAFLDVPAERALELYRILQEALNNSIKHSGCNRIAVDLYQADEDPSAPGTLLVAQVHDDGSGIRNGESGGMGLQIMRYRAEKADIRLTIEAANPGTVVRCALRVEE